MDTATQLNLSVMHDRFAKYIDYNGENGCWLWNGSLDKSGYGQSQVWKDDGTRTMIRTHRASYILHVGPIPDGLVLDHRCRTRRCCNPDHLEPVTVQINTLRGNGPAAINAVKTHCKRGHPFTPENTYVRPEGRSCRACRNLKHLTRDKAKRSAQRKAVRQRKAAEQGRTQ